MPARTLKRARSVAIGLCLMLAVLLVPSCGGEDRDEETATLVLGAYTTPREAYGKAIIPAFEKHWQERTGRPLEFRESYLGSGAQSRAVVGGFEADVVALSLEADVDRIEEAGLIQSDWKSGPWRGMVSTSIVVLAVRQGNPRGIRDWADLAQPGLSVLTPDPRTSGGAMWNICALYGAAKRGFVAGVPADDAGAAAAFLKAVFQNVSIMDKGARESITNFERGVGDVAITYENEVLVARQAGQLYDYVIPRSTILIENPAAVVDAYADRHQVREAAEAFLEYLWTPEAQRAYAEYGLRPVDPEVAAEVSDRYPAVQDLWDVGYLGGWGQAIPLLFGPEGSYTRMYLEMHGAR